MTLEEAFFTRDFKEEEAMELLAKHNPYLHRCMREYINYLLANIHVRDSYIREMDRESEKFVHLIQLAQLL